MNNHRSSANEQPDVMTGNMMSSDDYSLQFVKNMDRNKAPSTSWMSKKDFEEDCISTDDPLLTGENIKELRQGEFKNPSPSPPPMLSRHQSHMDFLKGMEKFMAQPFTWMDQAVKTPPPSTSQAGLPDIFPQSPPITSGVIPATRVLSKNSLDSMKV